MRTINSHGLFISVAEAVRVRDMIREALDEAANEIIAAWIDTVGLWHYLREYRRETQGLWLI